MVLFDSIHGFKFVLNKLIDRLNMKGKHKNIVIDAGNDFIILIFAAWF